MDKFQVYNRETNSWEDDNIVLMPGWNESFVIDKTTDSAKIKLKYKGNTVPNWDNNDWCRILHLSDGETGATYTSKEITIDDEENILGYTSNSNYGSFYDLIYNKDIGTKGGFEVYIDKYLQPRIIILKFAFNAMVGGQECIVEYEEYINNPQQHFTIEIPNTIEAPFYVTYPSTTPEDLTFESYVSMIKHNGEMNDSAIDDKIYTRTVYIPKNHEQYIIKNPTFVVDEINNEIDIQLELGEPIEITSGIIGENRSWTNQIEKTIDGELYKHDALNHYNVLQRFLYTTPANNDYYKSWASKITLCDTDLLKNTSFSDDRFSEPSLYGILFNKYDSTLGKTPVMYFDMNGENDKPFSFQVPRYLLQFERQDGFDKQDIELRDLVEDCTEQTINKSYANKADGAVSNIDNLCPKTSSTYVSEYIWAIPEFDTNDRIISGQGSSSTIGGWIIKTPHKIKNIKSMQQLRIYGTTFRGEMTISTMTRATTDISDKVYEKKVYEATDGIYNTRNAIWYQEGTNVIHLNNFYYQTNEIIVFRVEYESLIKLRYDTGNEYQIQINQVDGQIAEDRFSKYIQDYLASCNKYDLQIQKTVRNWEDIAEIGSRVIDGEKIYIITNVGISNRGDDYDVVYQLNENHIRKNDSIVAPQNIRKNIAIGYDNITERYSCLTNDFVLTFNKNKYANYDLSLVSVLNSRIFSSLLSSQQDNKYPQMGYIRFTSKLKKNDDTIVTNQIERLCDGAKFIINNSFCYNLAYENNAECGKKKLLHKLRLEDDTTNYDLSTSPEQQSPILYTDGFGENQYMTIELWNIKDTQLEDDTFYSYEANFTEEINNTNYILDNAASFPLTDAIESSSSGYVVAFDKIPYYKDMMETFNYTICLHIDADSNIILCKNFFENSIMIGTQKKLSYISTMDRNVQENEVVFENAVSATSSISYTNRLSQQQITITANTALQTGKSLILWDENEKPILIINDADKLDSEVWNGQILKLYC